MSESRPTITPAPDGPLIVDGLENLRNVSGPLEAQPRMALCRCGASGNKPFCDGTHATTGFSGAKLEERAADRKDSYAGERVTIHDNRGLCAHAGFCTDGLAAVWRLKQEPWIDADGASAEEIIKIVESCPSGALGCTVDGKHYPQPRAAEPGIFIAKNGPYVVTGCEPVAGEEPLAGQLDDRCTLCRCGHSKNKPFCDGSHWNGFVDDAN